MVFIPGGGGGHSTFNWSGCAARGLKTGPCLKPLSARKIYPVLIYLTKDVHNYAYPVLILHTSDIYPVLLLLTVKEMKNSTHILRESVLLIELTVTQTQ